MSKNNELTRESAPDFDVPTRAAQQQIREGAPPANNFTFLRPPVEDDELGRLGDYRVLRLLGTGGMGMVFLAEDIALCRPVALKVMRPDLNHGDAGFQRFIREARLMARIKHPNLVTVHQVSQDGTAVFLAMELLEGETLESWINRFGPAQSADVVHVGREVALGLATIHRQGLIHRDIKPANIWLEPAGDDSGTRESGKPTPKLPKRATDCRVKILDFGLARPTDDTSITKSGMIVGTPAYMAPEQARGKTIDARSDLFSLGCVLYAMCTGREPFKADSTMAQLAALVADDPEPIEKRNPDIPESLVALIMQLLAKDPDKRIASAEDVIERLRQMKKSGTKKRRKASWDRTEELASEPKSRSKRARRSKRGLHPGLIIGISIGGLAVLLLATFFIAGMFRPPTPEQPPNRGERVEIAMGQPAFLKDLHVENATSWPIIPPAPPRGKGPKDKGFGDKGGPAPDHENLVVAGRPASHGIFMHAAPPFEPAASVSFRLNKKYRSFHTGVGFNDSTDGVHAPIFFTVYGDGQVLWKSREMSQPGEQQTCTLPVADVTLLKLEVTAGGPEVRGAHAVWIDPRVE